MKLNPQSQQQHTRIMNSLNENKNYKPNRKPEALKPRDLRKHWQRMKTRRDSREKKNNSELISYALSQWSGERFKGICLTKSPTQHQISTSSPPRSFSANQDCQFSKSPTPLTITSQNTLQKSIYPIPTIRVLYVNSLFTIKSMYPKYPCLIKVSNSNYQGYLM